MESAITRDNQIVFIDRGSFLRHPSERKTPPPPKWHEEDNPGYDPREPFYDPKKDPYEATRSQRRLVTKREFKALMSKYPALLGTQNLPRNPTLHQVDQKRAQGPE